MAIHTMLFHHGMIEVGLPYAFQGQLQLDEVTGVPRTGPVRSLAATAHGRCRQTSWTAPATSAATWPR